ncbi:MAG: hypothetical protein R3A52_24625 [Polyangiales bacterium]
MQRAVEHHHGVLDEALRRAGVIEATDSMEWFSPVKSEGFKEYRDGEALQKLGVTGPLVVPLASFWPARGPVWDALGVSKQGRLILVEAKAHLDEANSPASRAGEKSLGVIHSALQEARAHYGAVSAKPWGERYYQYANRLAFQYFLNVRNGLPTRLVFLDFYNATDVGGPSSPQEWQNKTREIHDHLGLPLDLTAHGVFHAYVDVNDLTAHSVIRTPLSLDDPRWSALRTAYGDASTIPSLLRDLAAMPPFNDYRSEPYFSLWSALCHQYDVYTASYAAAPHVVAAMRAHPGGFHAALLQLVACIEIARARGRGPAVPTDLEAAYQSALRELVDLSHMVTRRPCDEGTFRVATAALAVAHGHVDIADALIEMEPDVLHDFTRWRSEQ